MNSTEHWSSPNGCHPDCPACAAEPAEDENTEPQALSARVQLVCRDADGKEIARQTCTEEVAKRLMIARNRPLRGESTFPKWGIETLTGTVSVVGSCR